MTAFSEPVTTQYQFGIGALWAVLPGTPAQPIRFGTVKNVTIEEKAKSEDLVGQARVAVAIGVSTTDISGTIDQAEIDANRFNALYWGANLNIGRVTAAMDEVQVVPAVSTYTVTVANGSNFVQDLGVLDANTGALLTPVTSGPTGDQYTVSPLGVYTFPSTSASRKVKISYDWLDATGGASFTPINPLQGVAPIFQLRLSNPYRGTILDMTLPNCVMLGKKLEFKNENFMIPNMNFKCFAGPNGQFMNWGTSNAKTGSSF